MAISFRLFQLVICLSASGMLAPAQAALIQRQSQPLNAEKVHLVCVKQAQQLLCDVEPSHDERRFTIKPVGLKPEAASTVPLLVSPQHQQAIADILIWLSYILPSGLILGILLSESHGAYRSAILKQHIDLLERLWQFSPDRNVTTDEQETD